MTIFRGSSYCRFVPSAGWSSARKWHRGPRHEFGLLGERQCEAKPGWPARHRALAPTREPRRSSAPPNARASGVRHHRGS